MISFLTPERILTTVFALLFAANVSAQQSARAAVPSNGVYAKAARIAGQITQLPEEKADLYGQAFIFGKNGCYAISPTHVVFGKAPDKDGTIILLSADRIKNGHRVKLHYAFNSELGRFEKSTAASVIEFGAFEDGTDEGLLQDIAVLKLDDCAGEPAIKVDRVEYGEKLHRSVISLAVLQNQSRLGINEILVQENCGIQYGSADGTIISSCESTPGSSGMMFLSEFSDGLRIVGMSTRGITHKGRKFSRGLYASRITEFLSESGIEGFTGQIPKDSSRVKGP